MSARDDVLAAVRAALTGQAGLTHPGGAPPEEAAHPEAAPGGGRTASQPVVPTAAERARTLDLFAERVADYRAQVTRCAAVDLPGVVEATLGGSGRVVVPPGLDLAMPGAVVDDGLTSADLDAVDAVVTGAAVAVAETGTVVLDHGPGQGRRAITLLPDLHVCIVRASQVVPDVGDALGRLDPQRPLTWISGPSATRDIELSRFEGVHGPRTLHVVLVAD